MNAPESPLDQRFRLAEAASHELDHAYRDYVRAEERLRRVERSWLPALFNGLLIAAVLALAYLHAATADTLDTIETWSEEKLARVARRQKTTEAVIWSARCERLGMDTLSKRADQSDRTTHCVTRRILKVPPAA